MKISIKNIVFLVLLIACFLIGAAVLDFNTDKTTPVNYSEVVELLDTGKVYSFEVDTSNVITMKVRTYDENGKEIVKDDGTPETKTVTYVFPISCSLKR